MAPMIGTASECPQYWKFKGGSTYVVEAPLNQAMSGSFFTDVKCIEYRNDYSEEYIVASESLVDDIDFDPAKVSRVGHRYLCRVDRWTVGLPRRCEGLHDACNIIANALGCKMQMVATMFLERFEEQRVMLVGKNLNVCCAVRISMSMQQSIPLAEEGECCDSCNNDVIVARIDAMIAEKKQESFEESIGW